MGELRMLWNIYQRKGSVLGKKLVCKRLRMWINSKWAWSYQGWLSAGWATWPFRTTEVLLSRKRWGRLRYILGERPRASPTPGDSKCAKYVIICSEFLQTLERGCWDSVPAPPSSLCDLRWVHYLLCTSDYFPVNWGWWWHPLHTVTWALNELTHIKCLEQCPACSKHSWVIFLHTCAVTWKCIVLACLVFHKYLLNN